MSKERDDESEDSVAWSTTATFKGFAAPHRYIDFSIHVDGITYYLRPKKDLTAYELYNINVWTEEMKLNSLAFNADKFYSRAEELGIIRHFELDAPR